MGKFQVHSLESLSRLGFDINESGPDGWFTEKMVLSWLFHQSCLLLNRDTEEEVSTGQVAVAVHESGLANSIINAVLSWAMHELVDVFLDRKYNELAYNGAW